MSMYFHLICFLSAIILEISSVETQSSPLKFGLCLVPNVKENFEPTRFFADHWYKQLGDGSLFQDIVGICPTVQYQITDEGEIMSLDYVYNQMFQTYLTKPGRSFLQFTQNDLGYFKFTYYIAQGLLQTAFPMYIIDTDYDDWAIVYYCRPFMFVMKTEAAWVMSRSRNGTRVNDNIIRDANKKEWFGL
uniref:Apolipoprotein d-like protein n=1 Tax=Triatoma infestans TaxID=30076 RepID=A0A171AZT3_TRIIF